MKLTLRQLEVLKLMSEGWELYRTPTWWMLRTQLRMGRKTVGLHSATAVPLCEGGLIEYDHEEGNWIFYALTEAGKKVLEDSK